jgi:hypothetical protein
MLHNRIVLAGIWHEKHTSLDELNNQIDNLMLFDNLKAKSFYLGLKDLDGRGITREVFEETMSTSSNCVSTCAMIITSFN